MAEFLGALFPKRYRLCDVCLAVCGGVMAASFAAEWADWNLTGLMLASFGLGCAAAAGMALWAGDEAGKGAG